jgi:hypothetical protein
MAVFAAAQYALYGLVAYIASGPHLRSPWLRLLIATRPIVDRSKNAWCLALLEAGGVWLQFSETALGRSHPNQYGSNSLVFVLKNYVTRFTDPNWTLAGVAALSSVGIFVGEMLIDTFVVQPRYVIGPALLLYAALAALMGRQGSGRARRAPGRPSAGFPPLGFAGLLLVAVTLNFRVINGRTTSPAWTSVVATAHRVCAMPHISAYTFVHEWWFVTIPCSKVG